MAAVATAKCRPRCNSRLFAAGRTNQPDDAGTLQVALDKMKGNPDAEPYVISGNSYFILLQPQQVLIEELYGDDFAEPIAISLDDFGDALGYWRTQQA